MGALTALHAWARGTPWEGEIRLGETALTIGILLFLNRQAKKAASAESLPEPAQTAAERARFRYMPIVMVALVIALFAIQFFG